MTQRQKLRNHAGGMTMVELMIAMVVLLVGVLGSLIFLSVSMSSNFKNRQSSNSTVMAQMIVEKIRSSGAGSVAAMNLNDCANNAHSITTAGSAGGSGGQLLANGSIDFTQVAGSAGDPAGYYMLYVDCGTAGRQMTYDVRWRIVTPASSKVKLITASARLLGGNTGSYSPAVTVRSIVGL